MTTLSESSSFTTAQLVNTDVDNRAPSHLMIDHPGWLISATGRARRAFYSNGTPWILTCNKNTETLKLLVETGNSDPSLPSPSPAFDTFDPVSLPSPFRTGMAALKQSRVRRVRNPDLWDAMLPPLFYKLRKQADGAALYRSFCQGLGRVITTELGVALLAPRPEEIISSNKNIALYVGSGKREHTLRRLAADFISVRSSLTLLSPDELFYELQDISGIGRWAAARIVADTTNNFKYFHQAIPHAGRHWPLSVVPSEAELDEFEQHWKLRTSPAQRSTFIALTMHRNQAEPTKKEAGKIEDY